MIVKILETDSQTKTTWYSITGDHRGTGIYLDGVYGRTLENAIVDCDNYSMTESDWETIAARDSIEKFHN